MKDKDLVKVEVEEVVAVKETAPTQEKEVKVKVEPKIEEKKKFDGVYKIVLVFNDYKSKLKSYTEEDGKIICGSFVDEAKANSEAKRFLERGILVKVIL